MRPSSSTRIATWAFLGVLLVSSALILATGLPVEYFGPVIVYDVSFVSVLLMLLAPKERER